jgi:hypothetical protein
MTSEPLVAVHNRNDPLSLNVGHPRSALTTGELRREFVRAGESRARDHCTACRDWPPPPTRTNSRMSGPRIAMSGLSVEAEAASGLAGGASIAKGKRGRGALAVVDLKQTSRRFDDIRLRG